MNQNEIADKFGKHRNTISKYLNKFGSNKRKRFEEISSNFTIVSF